MYRQTKKPKTQGGKTNLVILINLNLAQTRSKPNSNPTQTWPEPDLNLTQDLLPNNITNVNIVAGPSSLHIRGLHDKGDGRSQDWNFD